MFRATRASKVGVGGPQRRSTPCVAANPRMQKRDKPASEIWKEARLFEPRGVDMEEVVIDVSQGTNGHLGGNILQWGRCL